MAVIIRRNKPPPEDPWLKVIRGEDPDPKRGLVIKRRSKEHRPEHVGTGWVYIPGFPPDRTKAAYHCIEINGVGHAFLWDPHGQLGEGWTCGKWSCSAGVMAPHNYKGECTIVYRSASTPTDDYQMQRKIRR